MEIKQDKEELPHLLDPFMEEVRDIKSEILRVNNRVALVKGFYQHIRNSDNTFIRRELEDKVNIEIEFITTSLNKVVDILPRWGAIIGFSQGVQKLQRSDMEKGTRDCLKQALAEYEQVLNTHRDECLKELQNMLKVTKLDNSLEKGSAFAVDQAHLVSLSEQKHIEIEARYGELLRTDRHLRYLKTKFAMYLSSGEFTDLAVLHLSRLMDNNRPSHQSRSFASGKSLKVYLLASLSSLCLILILFYLLL